MSVVTMSERKGRAIAIYPFIMTDNIKFWCILIVFIPSVLCSLFTLYHFLFDGNLRKILNNHVIIIVLLISLFCQITIYPWMLYFFYFDGIWQRSSIFCSMWAFIDSTSKKLQTILFAWLTIERHILIFHDNWVATKKQQFFFHYLPLILLILYCLIFYVVVDFFASCNNYFINLVMACAIFCISNNIQYYRWENIVHVFVPTVIILVFAIVLFVRVIRQKIRINQAVQWRRYRRMTIQVSSILFIYLVFYFPSICVRFMIFCGHGKFINTDVLDILAFLTYYMMLFLPFVCMLTLPGLKGRIKRFWQFGQPPRRIHPMTIFARQTGPS